MAEAAKQRRARGHGGTGGLAPTVSGRRSGWVVSWALVLALVFSSFSAALAAAHQIMDGVPVAVAAAPSHPDVVADPADRDRDGGGIRLHLSCNGHCTTHAASLPPRPDLGLWMREAGAAWPVTERSGAVTWSPARLDRPPRA